MMVQATVVWLAFDAGALKARKGLSLAQLPEIEHYPDTELSKRVGGAIRSSLNMFFGEEQLHSTASIAKRSLSRSHSAGADPRRHGAGGEVLREAVDMLVSAHGTSSLADSNRMQRLWHDAHVASHHAITEWQVNLEIYGKALLGVEPNITPLI